MAYDGDAGVTQEKLDALEQLRAAKALIARPRGWCKCELAIERKNGFVAYCMVGALEVVGASPTAEGALISAINYPNIIGWNDCSRRRKAEVIAAFERAEKIVLLA